MLNRETVWNYSLARRDALRAFAGFLSGSPLLRGQIDPFRDHPRVPKLDELMSALEFEAVFHAKLPRQVYDYTAYGTDGEFTLRRNRQAFDWVDLVPGASTGKPATALQLFGTPLAYPILISPTAAHVALHPEGEVATRQGATAASNTPMIVSNVASLPIEKIGAAATGPFWFQLYPKEDAALNRETLERAQAAGCKAVVVTIDQQAAVFERELHDRHLVPTSTRRSSREPAPRTPYRIKEFRLFYDWKLFEEIRKLVKVPIIAKGVLTAEDAKLCLTHGMDGVYVSNHGGRSLDYAPSTLEVLPEIVDAVGGKVPVLFDSGVRRGSDILKALALGASAVCLGRVPRWGLGAYGPAGVQRILEIMQAELAQAMAATGRPTLASIDRTLVRTDFP
ncbi:MAG: alpha-hydroxy-acid oxidizing protein [Bryobacterales bacterium]|nr:alpha-hydroxy-acid oxidizing protein [Bryobacterales bacterium]